MSMFKISYPFVYLCILFFSDGLQFLWIYCRLSKFSCVPQHLLRTQVVTNGDVFHLLLSDPTVLVDPPYVFSDSTVTCVISVP